MNYYLKNFLLIILFLSSYLFSSLAIEIDDAKLFINSDALTLNNQEKSAIFTGHVVVKFEDITLTTTKLIVYYLEQDNKKTIDKISIPTALQAVKPCDNEIVIADSADYIVNLGQLTLTGNVRMLKENKLLITEKMVYITKIKNLK